MSAPLQVVFRKIQPSAAVETEVRERVDRLEKHHHGIMDCHVIVEHGRRRHQGNLFHVRVRLTVPDRELVASRDSDESRQHEDIYSAIRDAFEAVRRQLQSYAQRRRSSSKRAQT